MNDHEDQGYSLISDGCIPCQTWVPGATTPTRPALVKEARYGRQWWMCPKCHRSYGDAGPVTIFEKEKNNDITI